MFGSYGKATVATTYRQHGNMATFQWSDSTFVSEWKDQFLDPLQNEQNEQIKWKDC
jgi:hypothetical protein